MLRNVHKLRAAHVHGVGCTRQAIYLLNFKWVLPKISLFFCDFLFPFLHKSLPSIGVKFLIEATRYSSVHFDVTDNMSHPMTRIGSNSDSESRRPDRRSRTSFISEIWVTTHLSPTPESAIILKLSQSKSESSLIENKSKKFYQVTSQIIHSESQTV